MLRDIEKESLGLGVHLEYVLDQFQQWLDEFMSKFEWRVDGHGPATLDGFIQHQKPLLRNIDCRACFATNEHPRRAVGVKLGQSKALIEIFNSRSFSWLTSWFA